MVTIKEIAKLVNLSPTTVSNVIHGHKGKVSAENYKKISSALKDTNYISNMGARLLGHHGSKIIAVILNFDRRAEVNIVSDPFYDQIIGFLEEEIRKQGYFMMLYTSGSVTESLRLATAWDIEGLIILGSLPDDAKKFIQQQQRPLAFIDTYVDESYMNDDFINVGLQDFQGGYDITKYLISLGHRKIAFFADGDHLIGVDEKRFLGFKQALSETGISFQRKDFFALDYRADKRHAFLREISRNQLKQYTALVFTSDFLAVDAINVFYDNGIKVPRDFSITGFDHNIFSEQIRPKLTTIGQNVNQKAVLAVDYLVERIQSKHVGRKINILLNTELIVQGSTAKPSEVLP
ncbi:LacI family DNA-binding transcriptional regulator [Oenococcus kitaharae]|uniref:LacI family DNA-binding transcriptional regulator n=1 Tax=Oenococcus TaxID=46254 RepID=UPI0021E95327|nr:LacI family DNA-binding transcriptional regulator [Oenococcus kitaharae]MCV3295618.1 LacI family transcriptional regulator [Oenococcus kitaharae]